MNPHNGSLPLMHRLGHVQHVGNVLLLADSSSAFVQSDPIHSVPNDYLGRLSKPNVVTHEMLCEVGLAMPTFLAAYKAENNHTQKDRISNKVALDVVGVSPFQDLFV